MGSRRSSQYASIGRPCTCSRTKYGRPSGLTPAVEQPGDAGMREAGEDLPLLLEAPITSAESVPRLTSLSGGLLREVAVGALGEMDDGHAPFAELADDAPAADDGAGGQARLARQLRREPLPERPVHRATGPEQRVALAARGQEPLDQRRAARRRRRTPGRAALFAPSESRSRAASKRRSARLQRSSDGGMAADAESNLRAALLSARRAPGTSRAARTRNEVPIASAVSSSLRPAK